MFLTVSAADLLLEGMTFVSSLKMRARSSFFQLLTESHLVAAAAPPSAVVEVPASHLVFAIFSQFSFGLFGRISFFSTFSLEFSGCLPGFPHGIPKVQNILRNADHVDLEKS